MSDELDTTSANDFFANYIERLITKNSGDPGEPNKTNLQVSVEALDTRVLYLIRELYVSKPFTKSELDLVISYVKKHSNNNNEPFRQLKEDIEGRSDDQTI